MLQGTKENSLCNLAPDATPSARLPLIDRAAVRDWCEDLAPDDIVEILAGVPGEARKGIEEIRQAINSSDLARVKRVAHRMKGMAANIGAPLLAQIARDIEGATGSIEIVAKQLPILEQILSDTLEALSTLR